MRVHALTLAFRSLVHCPLFAATAIVLMALAAGANAAVFSGVRGVLLKPLPYRAAIALPAAWLVSRVRQSTVDGITARDPLTFITLPVTVLVVTLVASYFPARPAARVDPVTTMRAQ